MRSPPVIPTRYESVVGAHPPEAWLGSISGSSSSGYPRRSWAPPLSAAAQAHRRCPSPSAVATNGVAGGQQQQQSSSLSGGGINGEQQQQRASAAASALEQLLPGFMTGDVVSQAADDENAAPLPGSSPRS